MDTAGIATKKGPEEKSEKSLLSSDSGQRYEGGYGNLVYSRFLNLRLKIWKLLWIGKSINLLQGWQGLYCCLLIIAVISQAGARARSHSGSHRKERRREKSPGPGQVRQYDFALSEDQENLDMFAEI